MWVAAAIVVGGKVFLPSRSEGLCEWCINDLVPSNERCKHPQSQSWEPGHLMAGQLGNVLSALIHLQTAAGGPKVSKTELRMAPLGPSWTRPFPGFGRGSKARKFNVQASLQACLGAASGTILLPPPVIQECTRIS